MNPAPAATPAPRWTTRPSRPQSEGHQQQPSVTVLGLRIELLAVLVVLWCWARLAGPLGVGAALVVVAAVLGGLLPPAGTIRVADWQYARRQKTWFKRNEHIRWFGSADDAYGYAAARLNN